MARRALRVRAEADGGLEVAVEAELAPTPPHRLALCAGAAVPGA